MAYISWKTQKLKYHVKVTKVFTPLYHGNTNQTPLLISINCCSLRKVETVKTC